jgi:hypothetical protein
MAPRVSVLVPPAAAASRSLLSSLDRQSLRADEFEVLIGDDGLDPDLTSRLEDLVAHRTNLTRVAVSAGTDVAATLLGRASGEYVLAVPPERALTPNALAELSDRADATGADVCLGLTGRAGSRPAALPASPDQLAGPAAGLRRRASASAEQISADLAGADATADGAAVVASRLCFVDGPAPDRRTPVETDRSVRARSTRVAWSDGVLEVDVKLTEPADDVQASLYSDRTGIEWPLPEVEVDGSRFTLRIDPASVPGPGQLPEGIWWPSVRIGGRAAILVRSRSAKAHGATVRDRTVVSFARGKRLGIDVGGLVQQPVRHLDPEATTVVEDSRGSLLTSRLANLDLAPGARLTGELRLGTMPVVAWIERRDGAEPVLQAWVSGLAGESPLFTRFGPASFAPTGTRLIIDGVGTMTVAPNPEPAAAATAGSPATPPATGRERRSVGRALRSLRG